MSWPVLVRFRFGEIIGGNEMFSMNGNVKYQAPYVLMSLTQNWNGASKIDIVPITTQEPSLQYPTRIPGSGKEHLIQIAPDFDAPFEFRTE